MFGHLSTYRRLRCNVMAKANALALPKAMAMPRAKAMPRTWLGLWLGLVLLQWLAAGPSGAGRRDAMSGTRKAKQGHHQDNVHETNVFELHCENQHFSYVSPLMKLSLKKLPGVLAATLPPTPNRGSIHHRSSLRTSETNLG